VSYAQILRQAKTARNRKNSLYSHRPEVPKPTKAPFGSFVSTPRHTNVKKYFDNDGVKVAKVAKVARVATPKTYQIAEPTKDEKLHELDSLIQYVAEENDFSESDLEKAKFYATKDVENAITSFRALARDIRRDRAMELLQASPESLRAIFIDEESDPNNVILAIAVRHVSVSEMTVPRVKYDPWKLITILDKGVH